MNDSSLRGPSNTINFLNQLASSDELLNNLKSEREELKIADVDILSKKHQPSRDNKNIRLDRVLRSLLPEIEGLDEDLY